jgi:hypothetical protein
MGRENPSEFQFYELHKMIKNYWGWRSLDYIQLSWNSTIDYGKIIEGFLCNKDQGRVLRQRKYYDFLALNK